MPKLQTEQGTLFYAQRGHDHPAVVCIHGAGGSHQHWGLQMRGLSDIAQVVLLDLPGHGRSPGPGRSSIDGYSDVLLAALNALELEQVVLAGHSMGGAVALWAALHAPQRVAGLVLASTGARLQIMPAVLDGIDQNPVSAIGLIIERAYDQYSILSSMGMGMSIDTFWQTDPLVFQNDLLACDNFDVRGRLHEVVCPALVVCGATDQMTPLKFSRTLYEEIPDAEMVTVAQAGHMTIVEQPDAVNAAIRNWFTSQYRSD
jgi:pimeloyl-ACP methyl ester carboxylesterase